MGCSYAVPKEREVAGAATEKEKDKLLIQGQISIGVIADSLVERIRLNENFWNVNQHGLK